MSSAMYELWAMNIILNYHTILKAKHLEKNYSYRIYFTIKMLGYLFSY